MMSIADWEAFYAAQLGAAATLGGLVFVGLSLNLKTILSYPVLPSRALVAMLVILAALVISSLALIPGQSPFALGLEILASGGAAAIVCGFVEVNSLRKVEPKYRRAFVGNLLVLGAAVLPYVIGGAMLMMGDASGLYFVAAGMIVSMFKVVLEAWVLLVEILR